MRRFRLHRSSLVVGLATLVVLTLIVVPGFDESDYYPVGQRTLRHGWPRQFLERKVYWNSPWWNPSRNQAGYPAKGLYGVPWLSLTTWRFWEGKVIFSWTALALDVTVAIGITGATIALWEHRRRRRASAWQFRLAEVLFAMTALAAALAWLNWQRTEHNRELAIENALWELDELDPVPGVARFLLLDECSAPKWLQHLIGLRLLRDYLYRMEGFWFGCDSGSDCVVYEDSVLPHLKSLRNLRTFELGGDVADMTAVFRTLGELPQLRTLDLEWCHKLSLSASDANQLAKLKQLTKLVFSSRDNVTEEAQRILAQRMPHCEIIYVDDDIE